MVDPIEATPAPRLRAALARYATAWTGPSDVRWLQRFHQLLDAHPNALSRSCRVGHITASAWILDHTGTSALLTHHRKLEKWLQLGGHVDEGEDDPAAAALREAREESGLVEFEFIQPAGHEVRTDALLPLDLDIHEIPARGDEPAHEHFDVRYLMRAAPGTLRPDVSETKELRFVEFAELQTLTQEESVLRLHRRALAWLGG